MELCRIGRGTNHASAITVAKVSTTLNKDTVLNTSVDNLHLKVGVEIKKDYVVSLQGRKIRVIETIKKITKSNGEGLEFSDLNFFFIKNNGSYNEQYVVDAITPSLFLDEYSNEFNASLSTFTFN